jgi:hypothetical protein
MYVGLLYSRDSLLLTISTHFIVTKRWTSVQVGGPPGRTGHSMVTFRSKLFIFGGEAYGEFMNDLWFFDPMSRKCFGSPVSGMSLTVSLVRTRSQWTRYEHNTSDKPDKRTDHVCVAYEDKMIL